MHNDRSDEQRDSDSGPEKVFRTLKDRPADELDSGALWRRIEGDLEPRAESWIDRVAAAIGLGGLQPVTLRFAGVGAVAVLIVGIVWLAPGLVGPGGLGGPGAATLPAPVGGTVADGAAADGAAVMATDSPAELIPLTEYPDTAATEPVMPTNDRPAWILDVRLVRGYSGDVPADAMVSAGAGAGGADSLADLRAALDGLMPFDEIALVGQWQGAVDTTGGPEGVTATIARLSDSFELRFAAESAGTGVNLADVLLDGAGRPLVADQLALTPGRPYLFGVQAEGEDSDTGSLVLAVRLLPADPDGQSSPSEPSSGSGNSPEQR